MSKSLVAYFSASGVTKKVAEKLAKETGADLFEIQAETPYTNEDLNWQNNMSRSSIEMNDRSCRPAIRSKVEDMAQYDVCLLYTSRAFRSPGRSRTRWAPGRSRAFRSSRTNRRHDRLLLLQPEFKWSFTQY